MKIENTLARPICDDELPFVECKPGREDEEPPPRCSYCDGEEDVEDCPRCRRHVCLRCIDDDGTPWVCSDCAAAGRERDWQERMDYGIEAARARAEDRMIEEAQLREYERKGAG